MEWIWRWRGKNGRWYRTMKEKEGTGNKRGKEERMGDKEGKDEKER